MMLTIRDVERAVCLRYHLTHDQIVRRDPSRAVSRPRQIAMYLARELTGASYPKLGRHFARDHTSVLYAWRAIGERMEKDARLKGEIEGCKEILQHSGRWKENVARQLAGRGLAPQFESP